MIDHFARGQFMELTEADRLAGKSFDRLPAGVTVGTDAYAVSQSRTVPATYEEKILEPEPAIARFPWKLAAMAARQLGDEMVDVHVALGASARSARATATSLRAGGPGRGASRPRAGPGRPGVPGHGGEPDRPVAVLGRGGRAAGAALGDDRRRGLRDGSPLMATTYRFLPWARRGLAAALPEHARLAPGATPAMPTRAEVAVRVVVSGGVGDVTTRALLHGPGDVIGLDPAQVVRMYPLPGTSNAEPAYLACVDLDAPELPWLFTPLGVPGTQHLPPWLVLVVVEHRDGVSVEPPAGGPLPRLRIANGAAGELPNLADSWAWAHAQLLDSGCRRRDTCGHRRGPDLGAGPQRLAPHVSPAPGPGPPLDRRRRPRVQRRGDAWPGRRAAPERHGRPGMGGPRLDHPAGLPPLGVPGPARRVTSSPSPGGSARTRPRRGSASCRCSWATPRHPCGCPPTWRRCWTWTAPCAPRPTPTAGLDQVPDPLVDGLQEITRTLADAADGVLDGQELRGLRPPAGRPPRPGLGARPSLEGQGRRRRLVAVR